MARTRSFRFLISSMTAVAVLGLGCGGGSADGPGGPKGGGAGKPGAPGVGSGGVSGGGGMKAAGPAMGTAGAKGPGKTMGIGGSAVIVVGVPTTSTTGTTFPGGGPNGTAPLAPGCTPASARECPTSSGVCATSATSKPTGTMTGSICFYGPTPAGTTTTTTVGALPAATIEYLHETAGGQEYYRFRITFDPAFVDNTYGTNAIGWGQRGHTFKDLVGSDHAELSLFDGNRTLVSMFDLDYITANASSSCAYGALGVSGGEGKMLTGDPKHILAATTSLDRNLNGCGYCANAACGGDCTVASPATDARYTPNASAPSWDFRVVYEVWVDAAAFAGKGFSGASITFVHASPSKLSTNTVTVLPKPCCPPGQTLYETESGPVCKPGGGCPTSTPTTTGMPTSGTPVIPYQPEVVAADDVKPGRGGAGGGAGTAGAGGAAGTGGSAGDICICPPGYTIHGSDEFGHATCEPVPPCPAGYVQRTDIDGGNRCFPTPVNGKCPTGFSFVNDASGGHCI